MAASTDRRPSLATLTCAAAALGGPVALTALLLHVGGGQSRQYVFLYLGVVAALGVTQGLVPALLAAAASFLLLDYYFVQPYRTLTIASQEDVVNLIVFFTAAGVVGGLGSWRRRAQLGAEALTRELRAANRELARLGREQAEAAAVAVRLARTEQQVRLLEESDRVRREFLATVSHELRTPLAGVLTASTLLAGREELPGAVRDDAASIAEQSRRLNRLVGDMLDMARIEGNTLDLRLENLDLADAVVAAADRMHQRSPDRPVDVEVPHDTLVVADWDRLGQILDNLLLNAARFAPAGTPIAVRSSPGARGMVVVRVVDRGPGIPDDLRDRVFEHFVRGTTAGAGTGDTDGAGTGLGLAIVRGLVEAQAGRAWVDDPEDGVGTTIAFSLPAAPPDGDQP
jgi:two-component system sensor histidine kinase KdpD